MELAGDNCLDAWRSAAAVVAQKDRFNLIVTVVQPCDLDEEWFDNFSPHLLGKDLSRLSDVVNTIFPRRLAKRCTNRRDLYHRYLELHAHRARLGARKRNRWGTYFQRLTCFGAGRENQLEQVIEVVANEGRHFRVYNPMHTSSAETDSLRKRLGNPCLQYVQLTSQDGISLDMTALYRSQDFLGKALGNYIGLGQLLAFVARESGKQSGTLTCHSVRAYTESKSKLRQLAQI